MNDVIDSPPDTTESLQRQKRILLGVMLLLSAVFGILDSIYASLPGWEKTSFIADSLSFAFCLSVWCSCDAQLRGFRLSPGLRWTIILFSFIGFPIYAFKSRGRQGWSLLGLGFLFFLLLMLVTVGLGVLTDIIRGAV